MIRAYRMRGHFDADLDPLELSAVRDPELHPESYGFTAGDLDRPIFIDGMLGLESATLRQMLDVLRKTYCQTSAFSSCTSPTRKQKAWLQQRMEGADKEITFTPEGKKAILKKLIEAEGFERSAT